MGDRPGNVAAEPIRIKTAEKERLIELHSEVHPDGDAATCSVLFTNQPAFNVLVPFNQVGYLLHEIRQAASLMLTRQRLKADGGMSKLLEIAESASRPVGIDIIVDPLTADSIFVMQFEDRMPMAFRLAPDQIWGMMTRLAEARREVAN